VKTLAYALLNPADLTAYHLAELEAESVAYMVCAGLTIDSGTYSFGYVAAPAQEAT